MVGHAVPGVDGLQNLHRYLALLQQLTDEDRDQILGFLRIAQYFFLEELLEAIFQHIQKIRSQSPHVHGNQRVYINNHTICLCSICGLDDVLSLYNFCQIILLIHLADATSHTTVIRQRVLQNETSYAGLAAIQKILMDGLEAFLAIVIVCVNDDERSLNYIFCNKQRTPAGSSPVISLIS